MKKRKEINRGLLLKWEIFCFCSLIFFISCRENTESTKKNSTSDTTTKTTSTQIVSVNADIVAREESTGRFFSNHEYEQYFIVITLTNIQDTNIHFTVMTCSWEESFRFDTDSVFLYYPGCDSNFPTTIEILPHKTVKFFGVLSSKGNRKTTRPRFFKIGFVDLPVKYFFRYFYSEEEKEEDILKYKTYWSDTIYLKSSLYWYKEEK